jgi:hypothetical protein
LTCCWSAFVAKRALTTIRGGSRKEIIRFLITYYTPMMGVVAYRTTRTGRFISRPFIHSAHDPASPFELSIYSIASRLYSVSFRVISITVWIAERLLCVYTSGYWLDIGEGLNGISRIIRRNKRFVTKAAAAHPNITRKYRRNRGEILI